MFILSPLINKTYYHWRLVSNDSGVPYAYILSMILFKVADGRIAFWALLSSG